MPDSHVTLGLQCSVFIEVGQSAWARARGRSCFPSRVLWGSAFDWVVSMAPVSWSRAGPLFLKQKRLFLCFLFSTFQCFLRTGAMQLVRAFQSTHSCNPFCPLARSSAQLFLLFLHRLCFHVHPCSLSSFALVLRRCAGRDCRRRAFRPSAPSAQPEAALKARAHGPRHPWRKGRRRSRRRSQWLQVGRRAPSGCTVLPRAMMKRTATCRQAGFLRRLT